MNLESIPCEMLSLYKLHLNHIFWFKWPVIVFWGEEPKTLVLQTKLSWILSGQVFNTSGSRYHLVCVHICFRFGNLVHSFHHQDRFSTLHWVCLSMTQMTRSSACQGPGRSQTGAGTGGLTRDYWLEYHLCRTWTGMSGRPVQLTGPGEEYTCTTPCLKIIKDLKMATAEL